MNDLSTSRIDKLRWITLVLAVLIGSTSAYLNTLAVYITPLAEKGWDPAIIVVAYTIMMFTALPGSIIGGKLKAVFGNRFVLKTCGAGFAVSVLIASLATNPWVYVIFIGGFAPLFVYCIYVVQIANLGELFPDKRGMSTGAIAVGIFLIGAALVPMAAKMIGSMDVMRVVAILGIAIGVFTIICGFIVVQAPEGYTPKGWTEPEYETLENNEGGADMRDVGWKKLLTLPSFWMLFLAQIGAALMLSGMNSNFVMITTDVLGASQEKAAWLFSLFSIIMGCSGLVAGYVSDKVLGPVKITALTLFAGVVMSIIFLFINTQSTALYVLFILIVGIAAGTVSTLIAVILMNAYGSKNFGINFGLIQAAVLISSLVGPQLTVRTTTTTFFVICTVGMLFGAIMLLVTAKAMNKEAGKKIF